MKTNCYKVIFMTHYAETPTMVAREEKCTFKLNKGEKLGDRLAEVINMYQSTKAKKEIPFYLLYNNGRLYKALNERNVAEFMKTRDIRKLKK